MLLQEITGDNRIIIELSYNGQKYEFPSKFLKKDGQYIYIEPIRINGKVLGFNSTENITVSLIMVRDAKSPIVWKGVGITTAYEKEGTCYKVIASGEGYEVNRRGAFRLFVGISGVAQLGINKKAVDVIVKDVSETGFSFVSSEDMENVMNMPVRLVFSDFNQNYSLMGIIVRKVVINEAKILYGCQLSINNTKLEHYISQKQRQMLAINRDNSAYKSKQMLENALKEPGNATEKNGETEDDKNYKNKSIKNDGTRNDRKINSVGKTERRDIFRDAMSGKKV